MKLFFRKLGQGDPIIILHGLFGMSDNWNGIGKTLSATHTVYLVDQRNHGRSPHDPVFNYSVMSEDLLELIRDESIQKPSLLGHSMGGKTAMFFATTFPKKINKLIVADIGPGYYPTQHENILAALLSIDLKTVSSRKEVEENLRVKIDDEGTLQLLLKNLYWTVENKLQLRMDLKAIRDQIHEVGKSLEGRTPFTGPTLFVRGERSEYIRQKDQELITWLFPAVRFETINNAGHWVHADQPGAFSSCVLHFLNN